MKRCIFLYLIFFMAVPICGFPQPLKLGLSPTTMSEKSDVPPAPQPLEDLVTERIRITSHLEEASKLLLDTDQMLQAPAEHIHDQDVQSLQERASLLRNRKQIARRHLDLIEEALLIREEKRQAQENFNSWIGFPDPPPHPLTLVERLARDLKSLQGAITTDQVRMRATDHGSTLATDDLERAKKIYRQALEAMEATNSDEEKIKARKRHAESQLTLEVSEEGRDFLRASKQLLEEKLGLNHLREDLLRKKLHVALQTVSLSEEALAERNLNLQRQLSLSTVDLEKSLAYSQSLRELVEHLQSRLDREQNNKEDKDPLLPLEHQLRQKELEITLSTVEDINLRISYLQAALDYWRKFFSLQPKWDLAKSKLFYEEIETLLPIITEGLNTLTLARNEINEFSIDDQFADPGLFNPRQSLINTLKSRDEQLHQTHRSVSSFFDAASLWQQILKTRVDTMGLVEQAQGWKDILGDYLQRIWSFEILSVEDTIVVDGVRTLEKRPVTLGKVIQALLILLIGLLIASLLARLLSHIIFPFSAIHQQRRQLFQKVLRVALVVGVVILALVTVKIPLTVFAFLGGAIAIGIGFGAQNLLNNFISGFILLGENQIRVGDRIEIEGNEGIVKHIGNRCTQVRLVDGVEILIPNSQLLERSVTNMTLSDRHIRKTIKLGIAYGVPTRQIHDLLLEIVRSHHLVVVDPEPAVVFEDFGDNALTFCAYFWLDFASQKDFRAVISELRHTISERFAEHGFEIAYPQRDVHVDVKTPIPINILSTNVNS